MALDKATGTFPAPASAGQVTVVLPFVPAYVKFWLGDTPTLDAFAANAAAGYGWAVSTTSQHSVATKANDGITTNQSSAVFHNDSCIMAVTDGKPPSINMQANLFENFSVTGGGFKLDFTSTISGVQIHYAAYGGTAIANVSTVEFSQGQTAGTVSFTGAGFQPDLFEFLWDGKSITLPGVSGKGIGMGAAISSSKRWALSDLFKGQAGKAGKAGGHQSSTHCILSSKGPTSIESQSDFVSADADGGTVNVLTAKKDFLVAALCVQFTAEGGADLGVDTAPTTASVKDTVTTIDPDSLFLASINDPAPSGGVTDAKLSIGSSDGTNHASFWAGNLDNPSPSTSADQRSSATKALTLCTPGTPALDAECTATMGVLKFSLDWTTASPANEFVWLAMHGAAAAGGADNTSDIAGTQSTFTASASAIGYFIDNVASTLATQRSFSAVATSQGNVTQNSSAISATQAGFTALVSAIADISGPDNISTVAATQSAFSALVSANAFVLDNLADIVATQQGFSAEAVAVGYAIENTAGVAADQGSFSASASAISYALNNQSSVVADQSSFLASATAVGYFLDNQSGVVGLQGGYTAAVSALGNVIENTADVTATQQGFTASVTALANTAGADNSSIVLATQAGFTAQVSAAGNFIDNLANVAGIQVGYSATATAISYVIENTAIVVAQQFSFSAAVSAIANVTADNNSSINSVQAAFTGEVVAVAYSIQNFSIVTANGLAFTANVNASGNVVNNTGTITATQKAFVASVSAEGNVVENFSTVVATQGSFSASASATAFAFDNLSDIGAAQASFFAAVSAEGNAVNNFADITAVQLPFFANVSAIGQANPLPDYVKVSLISNFDGLAG